MSSLLMQAPHCRVPLQKTESYDLLLQNSEGYAEITGFMCYLIYFNRCGGNLREMFTSHACLRHREASQYNSGTYPELSEPE